MIVDEFTGRLAEGRKWRDGIHQAVEAKERSRSHGRHRPGGAHHRAGFLPAVSAPGRHDRHGQHSARELRKIYKLHVVPIPTQSAGAFGSACPTRVFGTADAKWAAIVEEVRSMHAAGRPVLIGTRSIDKSELLSRLLDEAGIEHRVLNAHHVAAEAEIVADAGAARQVTVSTNMAGRGTDIKLGEGVGELGGLHVICTEMHDSARIDRQLIGRCGRQGDPGTFRQFLALDDEILQTGLGADKAKKFEAQGLATSGAVDRTVGPVPQSPAADRTPAFPRP